MASSPPYSLDPRDPRAPSLAVWEKLTAGERQRVMDQLPSELELGPHEGDPHRIPKQRGIEALDAFFQRLGRKVYLSSELPVYYPGERMFAPDLIAVCDVEPGERMRWVVAHEGKGPDFALEVTLVGSRTKDLSENVERFARLGIPEYFVFDRKHLRLHGHRLLPTEQRYAPVVPQQGRWRSEVLGLDLTIEGGRFRFYLGTAVVPELAELVSRANALAEDLQTRLEQLEDQLSSEQQRAESAEARIAELEAELAQLRSERDR